MISPSIMISILKILIFFYIKNSKILFLNIIMGYCFYHNTQCHERNLNLWSCSHSELEKAAMLTFELVQRSFFYWEFHNAQKLFHVKHLTHWLEQAGLIPVTGYSIFQLRKQKFYMCFISSLIYYFVRNTFVYIVPVLSIYLLFPKKENENCFAIIHLKITRYFPSSEFHRSFHSR